MLGEADNAALREREQRVALGRLMLIEAPVIDKHVGIIDTIALQSDGEAAVAVVGVHHVGHCGTIFTFAIHHNAEQLAAAFFCIVVELAQGNEIVDGRAEVCVENHAGHSRILRADIFTIVINTGTGSEDAEHTAQHQERG